jgi:predicted nucleotide-binding protein (sugar kinase/HSP70/actin superfamily)
MKSIRETERKLSQIKINENLRPLKIGIVGEIYTTIDDYTSFGIQQKLGGMIVEVHRYVTVSNWITEHMIKQSLKLPRDLSYAKAARPYLGTMIGGHAQETIGNTIIYARNGYDGVIQIYPLTCMPEIVAESILPAVEKDYDIPVLTLIIDEMTGEAGYLTRVEAFIDLLCRRREKKQVEEKYILSGD